MTPFFSIITPCYKGKKFLYTLYKSLSQQSLVKNIEWIIVDDFSDDADATKNEIYRIEKLSLFPIKSIFLEKNYYGSKSVYLGSLIAKGNYSIILDQDDQLTNNALETFYNKIIAHKEEKNFVGVCGRCINITNGKVIGNLLPDGDKIANELQIRHIDKIRGEMFQCTKTNIISEYFFGMRPGNTNGWAWSRIARKYNYLYTNEPVRIYDTVNPVSGSNLKKIKYPKIQFEQLSEYITSNNTYLKNDKYGCFYLLIQWIRIAIHLKIKYSTLTRLLPNHLKSFMYVVYPIALVKSKRDFVVGTFQ